MHLYAEIAVSFFLVVSGIFGLVGSWGLIRLKSTLQRLHGPTKATTLGVGGALIASMLYFAFVKNSLSFHELLITIFLFLTAPVTANFIAKAFMLHHVREEELPETETEGGWGGYHDPVGAVRHEVSTKKPE
ncbi:MAG TPA: Na+/H+ antiporter subunit G [Rhodobacteraceae bacterium]|nr:Na+/H+ antiporter subunit G [Paracoccaceae bacterium]